MSGEHSTCKVCGVAGPLYCRNGDALCGICLYWRGELMMALKAGSLSSGSMTTPEAGRTEVPSRG